MSDGLLDLLIGARPEWWAEAACRGAGTDPWFPPRGAHAETPRDSLGRVDGSEGRGKFVCRSCPVRAECLEHALAVPEKHGVWGGLTARERRPLRRQWVASQSGREGAA